MDLDVELPECVEIKVMNNKRKSSSVKAIKVQYNILPKYCQICNLQGHEENECKTLHQELNRLMHGDKIEEKEHLKEEYLVQKRYVNGKVVITIWNPTPRRFKITRDTKRLMSTAAIEVASTSKEITNTNSTIIL